MEQFKFQVFPAEIYKHDTNLFYPFSETDNWITIKLSSATEYPIKSSLHVFITWNGYIPLLDRSDSMERSKQIIYMVQRKGYLGKYEYTVGFQIIRDIQKS